MMSLKWLCFKWSYSRKLRILHSIWNLCNGRRYYLQRNCVPVFTSLIDGVENFTPNIKLCLNYVFTDAWVSFMGDFYYGPLARYLKQLSGNGIKNILAHYVYFFMELCSHRGVWLEVSQLSQLVSDNTVWDAAASILPNVDALRKRYQFKRMEELISAISRLYIPLYVIIEKEIGRSMRIDEMGVGALYFGSYHPMLFSDSVEALKNELTKKFRSSSVI